MHPSRRFKIKVLLLTIGFATIMYLFNPISWKTWDEPDGSVSGKTHHLSKMITVVFRQFEEFENDIADSVQSFTRAFPHMAVVVICETTQYPPFPFSMTNNSLTNVKVISLDLNLKASMQDLNPLTYINTDFALFVPDSTRVSKRVLQQAVSLAMENSDTPIAIQVGRGPVVCQDVEWLYTDWTLKYLKVNGKMCGALKGLHCLLIQKHVIAQLPDPFRLPFPEALYLQTAVRNYKILVATGRMSIGRSILKTAITRQKALNLKKHRRIVLYKQIGVKLVYGGDTKVLWFGCSRNTPRCFPAVQGVPSYIISGRNTPPCCRRHLSTLVAHVLDTLQKFDIRCWLETTTLLGAVTRNNILPWAEYAEIGVYASELKGKGFPPGSDTQTGFVWEKATRGRYYRVAYSEKNRIYALVLPFEQRNGTMWPADWVLAHQKEFPEKHLQPLAQISFNGVAAPAPNNARQFLDLKLGPNSVERSHNVGPKLLYSYS